MPEKQQKKCTRISVMYQWIVANFTSVRCAHESPICVPDRYSFSRMFLGPTEPEIHLSGAYLLKHLQVHARMQESMESSLSSELVKTSSPILEQMRQRVAESEASDLPICPQAGAVCALNSKRIFL